MRLVVSVAALVVTDARGQPLSAGSPLFSRVAPDPEMVWSGAGAWCSVGECDERLQPLAGDWAALWTGVRCPPYPTPGWM